MSKIKIMSEHLSNRIAAGEVIERPASVVKELVENSIDAGAKHIRIEIEQAGTRLISVADNGSGMDTDDALLCIAPHGTSKIFTEADIDRINTLGFRGEALPSIAAVSHLSIITRTADTLEGTLVKVEAGRIKETIPTGCTVGTNMEVRDLFFNTPARRKFLKSATTESHHIEEMVLSLALPHPDIGFELHIDGRLVLNSPGSSGIETRVREFFGKQFSDAMWSAEFVGNAIRVYGLIASPGLTRNSRREQRTFVNGRAVESPTLYRGIREGYAILNEPNRYPPAILFIELPPEEVDVNVHPAKREVRFKNDFIVGRAVATAISNALKHTRDSETFFTGTPNEISIPDDITLDMILDSTAVKYSPNKGEQTELGIIPDPTPSAYGAPPHTRNQEDGIPPTNVLDESSTPGQNPAPEDLKSSSSLNALDPNNPSDELQSQKGRMMVPEMQLYPESAGIRDWPEEILGILDDTYILCSGRTGLIVVDQHAAHERIMFERMMAEAQAGAPAQQLLLPRLLELPATMSSLLRRSHEVFEAMGFDIEPMGSKSIMLNAIPPSLPENRPLELLIPDMLQQILDSEDGKLPVDPQLVARAACHAAIKAHDPIPLEEAGTLLQELAKCRQGTLCPHGRPTMLTITFKELERRFKRA